jgi:hypothetical protein
MPSPSHPTANMRSIWTCAPGVIRAGKRVRMKPLRLNETSFTNPKPEDRVMESLRNPRAEGRRPKSESERPGPLLAEESELPASGEPLGRVFPAHGCHGGANSVGRSASSMARSQRTKPHLRCNLEKVIMFSPSSMPLAPHLSGPHSDFGPRPSSFGLRISFRAP